MRILLLIIFSITVSLNGLYATVTPINFFDGSLASVKKKAASEGKLYLVDFYAKWCIPCKIMEESTFQDEEVRRLINSDYLAIKINVDDFDGFALKQQFNVYALPTIILFNSQGEMVDRYDRSLSINEMRNILDMHNQDYNKKKNVIRRKPLVTKTKKVKPVQITPPVVKVEETVKMSQVEVAEEKIEKEIPVKKEPAKINEPQPVAIKSETKIYKVEVAEESAEGYAAQIGLFYDYSNVMTYADQMSKKIQASIYMKIEEQGDKTVYRVLMGKFKSKVAADGLVDILKEMGQDAFVQNLANI